MVMDLPLYKSAVVAIVSPKSVNVESIRQSCIAELDSFEVPAYIMSIDTFPSNNNKIATQPFKQKYTYGLDETSINDDMLRHILLEAYSSERIVKPRNHIEIEIEKVWRKQLNFDDTISINDNFFDMGGNSILAGSIVNEMRKSLKCVGLSTTDLFDYPTIALIGNKVSLLLENGKSSAEQDAEDLDNEEFAYHDATTSSSSWFCLAIQSLPILIIHPMRKVTVIFLVAFFWVVLMSDEGLGKVYQGRALRFSCLIFAILLTRISMATISPLLGIILKWLIIGKYKAGRYPMWGQYYLRYWLVEQIIDILGRGIYSTETPVIGVYLSKFYLIAMGCKIAGDVKLAKKCRIRQFDLVTIEEGCILDECLIRAMTLEKKHLVLLPVIIQKGSSIGAKSIIAPGAIIPPGTHIGPLSSSHELEDASEINKSYCRSLIQPPPNKLVIFIGLPILTVVFCIAYAPWLFVIMLMFYQAHKSGWYVEHISTVYCAFYWWVTPQRVLYYFLLRIFKNTVIPVIKLTLAILIKKFIIGPFVPCDKETMNQPWNRFRYWLMSHLITGHNLCGVTDLVGSHYEIISIIYRLLGAKIGQRVYWPGSGFDVIEHDLIEIGDDVVFGSRSILMTRSTEGCKSIKISSNCMLADRCVVLPGTVLERASVIGSGGLAKEDYVYPQGSVYVGSRSGNSVCIVAEDILRQSKRYEKSPFGLAFYDRKASFYVLPLSIIILYNTVIQVFCAVYHHIGPILCVFMALAISFNTIYMYDDGNAGVCPHTTLRWNDEFGRLLWVCIPVYFLLNLYSLLIDISAKWLIIGQRKQGVYPWNTSDYCQRWQLYLSIQSIKKGVLDRIRGSEYINYYFRALGCTIGKNVCLYPNGGDPMMTEPDMVTIGDDVSVDEASLIAHINTKGVFSLNPLRLESGCVLKSNSRLLSGASMCSNSVLLEHTLILLGEIVEPSIVWQGWPCKVSKSLKEHNNDIKDLFIVRHNIYRQMVTSKRISMAPLSPLLHRINNDEVHRNPLNRLPEEGSSIDDSGVSKV